MSRRNQGMSLLQLLIAMSIGTLLMGSAMQIFMGIKQSYLLQQGLSRLQEKARTATIIFTELLRNIDNLKGFKIDDHEVLKVTNQQQISEIYLQQREVMQRQNHQVESLSSGVSLFSMEFGKINQHNRSLEFFSASTSNKWSTIRWLKLEIIFSSESEFLNKPTVFWFKGHMCTAPDRRLYLSWTMIIPVIFNREGENKNATR